MCNSDLRARHWCLNVVLGSVITLLSCSSKGHSETAPDGPVFGTWFPMTAATAVEGAVGTDAADWNGSDLFVWGNLGREAWTYNRGADAWQSVGQIGRPTPREGATVVWGGGRVLLWGTGPCSDSVEQKSCSPGMIYDPKLDTWTPMSLQGAPPSAVYHSAVWTGEQMIVWGGETGDSAQRPLTRAGGVYSPSSDSWTVTPLDGAPTERMYLGVVWTGTLMLVWGGATPNGNPPIRNDGARYDPKQNLWTPISQAGAPAARFFHTTVWTGTEMLVWGGECGTDACVDGAAYNPITDSWRAILAPAGIGPRVRSIAVWDGTEVVLWGGNATDAGGIETGFRWNPATDSWREMTTVGAPIGRGQAFAFWTGSQVLVWGGTSGLADGLNTGGFYTP